VAPLTRVPLEAIPGVDRNSPTGAKPAPARVYNGSFFRQGGIGPLAGRALNIAAASTNDTLLAYDESSMALFSSPGVFTNNLNLFFFTDTEFKTRRLTLIPRGAVVTEFIRQGNDYTGRAFVRSPQGEFAVLPDAPDMTVTQTGAGTIGNGVAFSFVCVVEAPSDAGLVAYGVSEKTHTTSSGNVQLEVELDSVIGANHIARFYWRTTQLRYSLLAALVSDGINKLSVKIGDVALPTHVAREDSIINFAPSRAELHEGRVYGVASDRPFMTIVPTSVLRRRDSYFQRAIQDNKITDAFTTTGAGDVMRVAGDYIEWRLRKVEARRQVEGAKVVIPLARMSHGSNYMEIVLEYLETGGRPRVRVEVNGDALEGEIPGPGIPSLGAEAASTAGFDALDFDLDILTVVGTTVTFEFTVYSAKSAEVITSVTLSGDLPNWAAWAASATTSVSLFASVNARDSFSVEWSRVLADTLIPSADSFLASVLDYASGSSWTSSGAAGETWTLATTDDVILLTFLQETAGTLEFAQPRLTLIYSDVGSANRGTDLNYFVLNASNSSRITALASTAAGLLVFMDNETWLLTGNVDPFFTALSAQPQARIQRFSGTIGCDNNVIPGRLGGVVFSIYKGELYAITLGMGDVDFGSGIELISTPLNLKEDPIVQVVGEPQTNHVVIKTKRNLVYRYDTRSKQWADDVFSEVSLDPIASSPDERLVITEDSDDILLEDDSKLRLESTPDNNRLLLIPACLCGTYATRVVLKDRFAAVDLALKDKVAVRWDRLDFGDKTLDKLWRRVEAKTSPSYQGTPTLTYESENVPRSTVSGVSLGNGNWVFSFGRGVVSSALDIELEFTSMAAGEVFEPPVVFEFASRNRPRGRVA
jgi:hypothetical protein